MEKANRRDGAQNNLPIAEEADPWRRNRRLRPFENLKINEMRMQPQDVKINAMEGGGELLSRL